MTRFTFEGTGRTTGGSPGPVVLVIALAVLAGSGGAVAAVSAALVAAVIAAAALVVLTAAGLAAFLVYRARRPLPPPGRGIVPAPAVHELPGPASSAAGPREVHQHQHVHLHVTPGTDLSALGDLFRKSVTEGNE